MSLEGFAREYQRGDSLESFSGVCLWRDFLGNIRGMTSEYQRGDSLESFSGVCLWRDALRCHTACVTGRCISGIPELTIVGPHLF